MQRHKLPGGRSLKSSRTTGSGPLGRNSYRREFGVGRALGGTSFDLAHNRWRAFPGKATRCRMGYAR